MLDWYKYDPGDAWRCSCDNLVTDDSAVTLSNYADNFEIVLTCPFCKAISTHTRKLHETDLVYLQKWGVT